MKVLVVGEGVLETDLSQIESISEVKFVDQIEIALLDCDLLIINQEELRVTDFAEFRRKNPKLKVILLSTKKDLQLKHLCNAFEFYLLDIRSEDKAQLINKYLLGDNFQAIKNVISFNGCYTQVGTTTVTHSVAAQLAKLTNNKICVLGLDVFNPSNSFCEYEGTYLDELKTLLSNQDLDPETLIKHCDYINGYHFLAGNSDIKKEYYYLPEDIDYLISLASEVFDIVLIDGGWHFDNALSVTAIKKSDVRFMIVNQQRKVLDSFKRNYTQILGPLGIQSSDLMLIVNQYRPNPQLLNEKQISLDLEIPFLAKIDYEIDGIVAEMLNNPLDSPSYPNIKVIIGALKLQTKEPLKEKKKLFRLFG
ncbi:hypothetical protein M1437_02745 [Patescibacteria group bacterium]|nr:hypothetical protein [Patescibacteria group bacterium]